MRYYSESEYSIFHGTPYSAGLDLPFYDVLCPAVVIQPHTRASLLTGVHVEIPEGHFGLVDSRSSTSKLELMLLCHTIDSDFRGNIRLVFQNVGQSPVTVKRGDYLAQLILVPYKYQEPLERVSSVSQLSSTTRGAQGFGSTTKRR